MGGGAGPQQRHAGRDRRDAHADRQLRALEHQQRGADLGSGATLALHTKFTFNNGSLQSGAGTLQIASATTTLDASVGLGNVDLQSTLVAASGTVSKVTGFDLDGGILDGPGTVTDSGSLALGGSSVGAGDGGTLSAGADLVANGAGTESAGQPVIFDNTSTLEIGGSGSLTLGDGQQMANGDGSASQLLIDSGATVSYPAGANTDSATITLPVVNSGALGVTGGTLTLNDNSGNSSTNNGVLTVGSGATMALDTPFTFNSGSSQSGAGTLQIANFAATTTLNASVSLGNVDLQSTLVVASGAASTVTGFDLDGGTLDGPGTVTDSGSLTLGGNGSSGGGGGGGSSRQGALSGGADLIANGTGTESPGASVFFSGASTLEIGRYASLTLGDGAQMDSDGSANSLKIHFGGAVSYPAGATNDTSSVGVTVINNGTLGVTGGTLMLNDSSPNSSMNNRALTVGAGATMALETAFTFNSGSSQSGAGTLQIGSGTTTLSASVSLGNVDNRRR